MKINKSTNVSQSKKTDKMPGDYSNMGPDGPNREVSDDGIWNFSSRDGVDFGGGSRNDSSYFGCGDSGGDSGGAFLG